MKQLRMENEKLLSGKWFGCTKHLFHEIPAQIGKIYPFVFESGANEMLKRLFDAVEAMLRAVMYLLILLMGAAVTALGAFITFFLAYRIGQFLYVLILKGRWL